MHCFVYADYHFQTVNFAFVLFYKKFGLWPLEYNPGE